MRTREVLTDGKTIYVEGCDNHSRLSGWAAARMAAIKQKVAEWNAKAPGTMTWQKWWAEHDKWRRARTTQGRWQALSDMKKYDAPCDRALYIDNFDYFRNVKHANEADGWGRREATGYYCDSFQSNVCDPVIMQLTRACGEDARWIPGVRFTDQDDVACWPLDRYGTEKEAARAAHHNAEREAEAAREYDAKDRAEQEVEEQKQTIKDLREERRALIRELRRLANDFAFPFAGDVKRLSGDYPLVAGALKSEIARCKREIRAAHKRISKLEGDFWESVA